MSAIFRLPMLLVLLGAAGVYLYWSLDDQDVSAARRPAQETIVGSVGPTSDADMDEELDYRFAQRIASLAQWRAFLASHPDGKFAQLAKDEVRKFVPDSGSVAPPVGDESKGSAADVLSASDAGLAGSKSAPTDDAPRPMADLDPSPKAQAGVAVPDGVTVDGASANEAGPPAAQPRIESAAASSVDAAASGASIARKEDEQGAPAGDAHVTAAVEDACRLDAKRLEALRGNPSRDKITEFAGVLKCENLRPQLLRLADSLGDATPPRPAGSETRSSGQGQPQGATPAGDCVSEQGILNRVRMQPSSDAVQQLWRNLRCERLRPQVRLLLDSLDLTADPSGACRQEAEDLNRIRSRPDRREAEAFARNAQCAALKPQAARLLESLSE